MSTLHTQDNSTQHAWFLVGQSGPISGQCFPVRGDAFTVGRNTDMDLSLSVPTVSSQHAELVPLPPSRLLLRDLNSTNGTFVNGERVNGEIEVGVDDIIQFADVTIRLQQQRPTVESRTLAEDVYDQALALVQLDKLLNERAVTPFYQPIIEIKSRRLVGQEVLGRSRLLGLETPLAMFRAAAKLNLEVQLSQMLRWEGVSQADKFARRQHLYVNTHPAELKEPTFLHSLATLRDGFPDQPITMEIHEGAVTEVNEMRDVRATLTDLNMGLAFDDFGAGQARLVELIEVKPDVLKFDISLIRGLETASPAHQQLVASLVKIALDLGVIPLAEGVENEACSDVCEQLGFQLGQGYHYGRPAPIDCN